MMCDKVSCEYAAGMYELVEELLKCIYDKGFIGKNCNVTLMLEYILGMDFALICNDKLNQPKYAMLNKVLSNDYNSSGHIRFVTLCVHCSREFKFYGGEYTSLGKFLTKNETANEIISDSLYESICLVYHTCLRNMCSGNQNSSIINTAYSTALATVSVMWSKLVRDSNVKTDLVLFCDLVDYIAFVFEYFFETHTDESPKDILTRFYFTYYHSRSSTLPITQRESVMFLYSLKNNMEYEFGDEQS